MILIVVIYVVQLFYLGELGYSLIKSLRGRTSGRKLKRTIFKFGIIQLICGTSLTVITILACMCNIPVNNHFIKIRLMYKFCLNRGKLY